MLCVLQDVRGRALSRSRFNCSSEDSKFTCYATMHGPFLGPWSVCSLLQSGSVSRGKNVIRWCVVLPKKQLIYAYFYCPEIVAWCYSVDLLIYFKGWYANKVVRIWVSENAHSHLQVDNSTYWLRRYWLLCYLRYSHLNLLYMLLLKTCGNKMSRDTLKSKPAAKQRQNYGRRRKPGGRIHLGYILK